jgi:anaphase-promoting complex subunit 3
VLDPKTPQAYSLLGNIHLARGATDAAKRDFRAAIAANPRNISNYLALEAQSEREGNWDEAKTLCEKAHQIDPESPTAAGSLAVLYLDHGGDVNVAVSLAQKVKQKIPRSPLAADTLGWAYYKLGSLDSAIAELRESVRASPHNSMSGFHLGMAYLADGQPGAARRALQKALADDPKSPLAASITETLGRIAVDTR